MACDTMKETHQQKGKDMNLLFVIDDAYVEQLKVVLYSIVQQMPKQAFQVFLMQQVLLKKLKQHFYMEQMQCMQEHHHCH